MKYTFDTIWRNKHLETTADIPSHERQANIVEVENGIVLPPVPSQNLYWGLGGVVSADKKIIEASIVPGAFGGIYDFDDKSLDYIDEEVFFCGVLPLQWGHFIIDFLCRLWPINKVDNIRIAYFLWIHGGIIKDNYAKAIELLGISKDLFLEIKKPTRFRKLHIPQPTMSFGDAFDSIKYRNLISVILENGLDEAKQKRLKSYSKIYFTRTQFSKWDIGEWEIEKGFKQNGFVVLSPEKLSLVEQIYYIRNADVIASLSGTIPHNYIFARPETKLLILNRFFCLQYPQYRINYMFHLNVEFIDVYHRWQKDLTNYKPKPNCIWVEFTECLSKYFKDHSMIIPRYIFLSKIRNCIMFFYYWTYIPMLRKYKTKLKRFLCGLSHIK